MARTHVLDRAAVRKALLLSAAVEIVTLPVALLTMGHAGPEGRFALLGWACLLINFPGLAAVRTFLRPSDVSPLTLALLIGAFQVALLGCVIFAIIRVWKARR